MPRCLVTRRLPGTALDRLTATHEVDLWTGDMPPSPEELRRRAAEADGLLCLLTDRIDRALLDAAPRLRAIANYAVGSDNIDLEAAAGRGIPVGVTPDVLTNATADLTLALLLAAARRLPEAQDAVLGGRWRTWDPRAFLGLELDGASLAVVGPGRIGRAVARRAEAFGMRVETVGRGDDLHAALARADAVSLHAPLTDATRHLIDATALAAMRATAILVNTARGGLVDQAALAEALHAGAIGAAALDVTDPEPPATDDPLLRAPRLLVVPHIGSATQRARERMADLAVDNLLAALDGRRMPHPAAAQHPPMRVAVADIGTNSTRLLLADVDERSGAVTEIERRTTVTRLGQGVDQSGALSDQAVTRVFAALDEYRDVIESHGGADRAIAVLTSAVRDASNGASFTARIREEYGLDARTIPGAEEARLTFLGATSERQGDDDPIVVIDIGGGSTELVVGRARTVDFFESTQAGVVRQTERHITTDPPDPDELAELAEEVRAIFADALPEDVRARVCAAVAVAGTATSVAAIDQDLEPYDPARVHGHVVSLGRMEELLARLAAMTEEQRRQVDGLHPDRAPTIVAGIVLLIEALRAFGLEEVEVSEHDILRGAALDAAASSGV